MTTFGLARAQVVLGPLDVVFAFFSEARNLEQLTPSWLRFEVLTPEPIPMHGGTLIEYRLRLRGVALRWVSLIEEWEHAIEEVAPVATKLEGQGNRVVPFYLHTNVTEVGQLELRCQVRDGKERPRLEVNVRERDAEEA